jgi:hypothetical protein
MFLSKFMDAFLKRTVIIEPPQVLGQREMSDEIIAMARNGCNVFKCGPYPWINLPPVVRDLLGRIRT